MTDLSDRPGAPGETQSDVLAGWFSGWADALEDPSRLGLACSAEQWRHLFGDGVFERPGASVLDWLHSLDALFQRRRRGFCRGTRPVSC